MADETFDTWLRGIMRDCIADIRETFAANARGEGTLSEPQRQQLTNTANEYEHYLQTGHGWVVHPEGQACP